jgi:hypothetical protein
VVTLKGLVFDGLPATPLPEARFRYTDFVALSGPNSRQLAPLYDDFVMPVDHVTYDLLANLELDGCSVQGGWVWYVAGGRGPRTLTLRNSIFERARLRVFWINSEWTVEEQFTAANNLFYYGDMVLLPISGANWTFTDNIFDHVTFVEDEYGNRFNGPVANNHHNAYIGMVSGGESFRLTPAAPTSTDPDLSSLTYVPGTLGRFYLPTGATLLIDKGSRSAQNAGLFHFTSLTSNAKEGDDSSPATPKQVDIGPHYLALSAGKPRDYDADGIADFIEDLNGDGQDSTLENPWRIPSTGSIAVLSPLSGSTVSGILPLRVKLGTNPATVRSVYPLVDGRPVTGARGVVDPAESITDIEVDTKQLTDGPHTFSVFSQRLTSDLTGEGEFSDAITLTVANDVRFPEWVDHAEFLLTLRIQSAPMASDYTLSFYSSETPLARTAYLLSEFQGTTSGSLTFMEEPELLGYESSEPNPIIAYAEFTFPTIPPTRRVLPLPGTRLAGEFPMIGEWAAAYQDGFHDYANNTVQRPGGGPIYDRQDPSGHRYCHDLELISLLANGSISDPSTPTLAILVSGNPGGLYAQTWPIRTARGQVGPAAADTRQLIAFLSDPRVRNFHVSGHGYPQSIATIPSGTLRSKIKHRYRYVFLDGCSTAAGDLFECFGMQTGEKEGITDESVYSRDVSPPHRDPNKIYERPAAFVGWKTLIKVCHNEGEAEWDEAIQQTCDWKDFSALSNWHKELLYHWRDVGMPLDASINLANTRAVNTGMEPNAPDWKDYDVPNPDRGTPGAPATIKFRPQTCLKVSGYTKLAFREFNRREQWLKQQQP